jgi:molybdenum cofactor sulfurtransferase
MDRLLRDEEFSRLRSGLVYADHAGAGLHCDFQAVEAARLLNSRLFVNPHTASSREVAEVTRRVLAHFGANERDFSLIWTSGATAALKLVGENFDWEKAPWYGYHSNVHNSALGIREYAKLFGATVTSVPSCDSAIISQRERGLFCVSGQCNFSGRKVDVAEVRRRLPSDVFLLVDGASLASSSQSVNLVEMGCDFFCVSFYKLFGLPSGLGALIVRTARAQDAFGPKRYFGGGTVEASSASDPNFVVFRKNRFAARYEDGTVPFLSIVSLACGLDAWNRLHPGEEKIFQVAAVLAKRLLEAKHWNGKPAFVVYGDWSRQPNLTNQGPIVAFNVLGADGHFVGYSKVEALAVAEGIVLRTGCFCNPGACEEFLGLTLERVVANVAAGKVCWDDKDVMNNMPTGAVRLSFGWCSTMHDAEVIGKFLLEAFVQTKSVVVPQSVAAEPTMKVSQILLYPIKSCAAMSVRAWPLGDRGLAWDREFVLLEQNSLVVMTQKRYPRMCLVRPEVDEQSGVLRLSSSSDPEVVEVRLVSSSVCLQSASVAVCGSDGAGRVQVVSNETVSAWLSRVVGEPCVLGQLSPEKDRKVGFANDAQLLVVSQDSVDFLNHQFELSIDVGRFRPNLVLIGGSGPHFEDDLQEIVVGNKHNLSFVRACSRCEMICIDQDTAQVGNQPLRAISSYRRRNGRVEFGTLFECKNPTGALIKIDDQVHFAK